MTQLQLQKKVIDLEAEIAILRVAVQQQPNNSIDETNWEKIKSTTKAVRQTLYQQRYGKK